MKESEATEFVKKVKSLPGRERMIFVRITFLGWSEGEVATSLHLPESVIHDVYKETSARLFAE